MKILIVSTNDIRGGAGRATYRLHEALIKENINTQMLVLYKFSNNKSVIHFNSKLSYMKRRMRDFQLHYFNQIKSYPNRTKGLFSSSFLKHSNIVDAINELNPDVVHLHWICDEMLRIEDLAKIKAPIVWSLHDMWAFTGGCHYDDECGRYVSHCGQCKVLNSKNENDLSQLVFRRKLKSYMGVTNMTIVGLSNWLYGCIKKSSLLKSKAIKHLPNPINVDVFKPVDKKVARSVFSLPMDKKIILFGTMGVGSDPRKGFLELEKAIELLDLRNIEFVVLGSNQPDGVENSSCQVRYLGQLTDDTSLQMLFSACDVTVVPSLQENLSNMIMESLSCGTPVVAFDIGGNTDMIEHKRNGYLASKNDSADLAKGIEFVLNAKNYRELCGRARSKVLESFESKLIAKRYIELYKEILD